MRNASICRCDPPLAEKQINRLLRFRLLANPRNDRGGGLLFNRCKWDKILLMDTEYKNTIRKHFPELTGKIEVLRGQEKDLVFLDKKCVFIFPKSINEKSKLKTELNIFPQLELSITLPIPNFKYVPIDCSFAGYDYLPGKCLTNDVFEKLSLEQKDMIANQVSIFLNELHSFPLPTCRRCGIIQATSEKEILEATKKEVNLILKKISKDEAAFLNSLIEHCSKNCKEVFKYALCHKKIDSDHLIFSEDNNAISGVISFGRFEIDDPASDFAYLWEYGEDFVDKVLYGYFLNSVDFKQRSLRWYTYILLNDAVCGLKKNDEECWKKKYERLKLITNNLVANN